MPGLELTAMYVSCLGAGAPVSQSGHAQLWYELLSGRVPLENFRIF